MGNDAACTNIFPRRLHSFHLATDFLFGSDVERLVIHDLSVVRSKE